MLSGRTRSRLAQPSHCNSPVLAALVGSALGDLSAALLPRIEDPLLRGPDSVQPAGVWLQPHRLSLPSLRLVRRRLSTDWSVKYYYRQPNLGDGKDESRTWGADRIKRSLAAGQHRGSTSAFRGALCALVANRTGPKTLLLRPNWTEPDCQSPGSIPVTVTGLPDRVNAFGQFWAMRDGSHGNYGTPGNGESATYRSPDPVVGSNLTLTASIETPPAADPQSKGHMSSPTPRTRLSGLPFPGLRPPIPDRRGSTNAATNLRRLLLTE